MHNALSSFVKIDLDLLREVFYVEELYVRNKASLRPIEIWKAVRRNDLVFGWFSSWHTFLPVLFAKILKRRVVLITGGYDTANIKIAKYGNQRRWWSRLITNWNLKQADRLICNSQFTRQETIHAVGSTKNKIDVIYHGIPERSIEASEKLKIVLNVGNVSKENLLRKGILPFVETASLLKDYQFIQVGKWQDDSYKILQSRATSNVEIKGYITRAELDELMMRCKYYVQPSLHEGFGMSVVEAMQAGCIPIISKEGALPEVIKEFGIYLDVISKEDIAQKISHNANEFSYTSQAIQNFVLKHYNLENRKQNLIKVINTCFL